MILKKIHLVTLRLLTFRKRVGGAFVLPQTLPVCARDPSLRLKNGSGQDDADEGRKFFESLRLRHYPNLR
jgi:hypothetical protein